LGFLGGTCRSTGCAVGITVLPAPTSAWGDSTPATVTRIGSASAGAGNDSARPTITVATREIISAERLACGLTNPHAGLRNSAARPLAPVPLQNACGRVAVKSSAAPADLEGRAETTGMSSPAWITVSSAEGCSSIEVAAGDRATSPPRQCATARLDRRSNRHPGDHGGHGKPHAATPAGRRTQKPKFRVKVRRRRPVRGHRSISFQHPPSPPSYVEAWWQDTNSNPLDGAGRQKVHRRNEASVAPKDNIAPPIPAFRLTRGRVLVPRSRNDAPA
jgi:hypothetical protein